MPQLFFTFPCRFSRLAQRPNHRAISTDTAFEYLEVFQEKFSESKSSLVYDVIEERRYAVPTEVHFKWGIIVTDPDDDKFVDCAVAANADYIVTNDKHFNILNKLTFLQ